MECTPRHWFSYQNLAVLCRELVSCSFWCHRRIYERVNSKRTYQDQVGLVKMKVHDQIQQFPRVGGKRERSTRQGSWVLIGHGDGEFLIVQCLQLCLIRTRSYKADKFG
ncbi:hypothetical protein OIU77_008165 [Salix suchowensis]|uniref:Uncharacterized protein n=1 Tax=Salix suchowensis TaxID=1278906 RepID=A0ABQ9AK07_9ROSI|nr:hypothetical protein OIU77_008165 [Salix suchowensis]